MIGRLFSLFLVAWLLNCPIRSFGQGGPVVVMDDIEYWIGAGSNRSALVIDWSDQSPTDPALVWGYRWDGVARGADMFEAIVTDDDRLFAKVNLPAGSSTAIYGLGYDATGDQQFALDDDTVFDAAGFAVTGPADIAVSVDIGDFYAEGWLTGFWNYGVYNPITGSSSPYDGGSWSHSEDGMASRNLDDGSWDSWTFTPTFDFTAFAKNPHAAEAPVTPGDFEPDGDVDGADLLTWQRGFGITSGASLAQGDANGDGMVDGDDLNLWQANFDSMASTTAPVWAVPEPSAEKLAILLLLLFFPCLSKKEKFMKWQLGLGSFVLATGAMLGSVDRVAAQYAVEVISYAPGTTPATGFMDQSAPLSEPEHFTGDGGDYPGVVSPFNPPFLTTEIISVGEGGQLTLRLSNFVLPQIGSPEIGIFTNAGLFDANFPSGQAGSPPGTFGVDRAMVKVSENGVDWEILGTMTFDIPTNGYTDLATPFSSNPGSSPTDFQQTFTGSLDSFAGLPYSDVDNPDILDLLAGSGGGTWLDISGTSLSQVGYIRFIVEDDGTSAEMNFELDAVSIASSAMGEATVPEPSTLLLVTLAGMLLGARRRNPLLDLE